MESGSDRPNCLHCIHAVLGLCSGAMKCNNQRAHADLGEEVIARHLASGEHDCPFFEDDMLPW